MAAVAVFSPEIRPNLEKLGILVRRVHCSIPGCPQKLSLVETAMADIFWRERIVWGVRWRERCALVFGAFAALLFIIDGPRSFHEHGTSLSRVLAAYAASGV